MKRPTELERFRLAYEEVPITTTAEYLWNYAGRFIRKRFGRTIR